MSSWGAAALGVEAASAEPKSKGAAIRPSLIERKLRGVMAITSRMKRHVEMFQDHRESVGIDPTWNHSALAPEEHELDPLSRPRRVQWIASIPGTPVRGLRVERA